MFEKNKLLICFIGLTCNDGIDSESILNSYNLTVVCIY